MTHDVQAIIRDCARQLVEATFTSMDWQKIFDSASWDGHPKSQLFVDAVVQELATAEITVTWPGPPAPDLTFGDAQQMLKRMAAAAREADPT